MASTVETNYFRHKQLPDARTYIRLLEINSVDQTRDISVHCKLTTWLKAAAPAYTAISYTWGDPNLLATILINGKRMQVRRNCEDVLRQPCWNKNGYFWMDAICINQADNDEKSFQVAKMGKVFRDARQTLACVGLHENDSEFLFERLHKHQRRWARLSNSFDGLGNLRDRPWLTLRSKSTLIRLCKALSMFLRRPYFHRVWIYQELFLGKNIQVCCEDKTVELSSLRAIYMTHLLWIQFPTKITQHIDCYSLEEMEDVRYLLETVKHKSRLSLRELIPVIRTLQSEDIRDRVFGILSTIKWHDEKPIRPDYDKDPFDLAVEVLQRIKINAHDLIRGHYFIRTLSDTIMVAKLMGLPDQPSSRLDDEIQVRRLKHSEPQRVNPARLAQEVGFWPNLFWGYRIYFHNASWHTQSRPSKHAVDRSALKHQDPKVLPNDGPFPTIQKWSKGTIWDVQNTDVLLPEEAQPQDWLLVPSLSKFESREALLAFVARDIQGSLLQLIGKALFAARKDRPRESYQSGGYKYRVFFSHEDAIVLTHSLNWREGTQGFLSKEDEPHKLQVDDFFETRLCGERSQSYAILLERRESQADMRDYVSV